MNFRTVPGMLVCGSFLISVCKVIVSKALVISSFTVIVRAGGGGHLNPFATVVFSVCSAVTVDSCVLTRVARGCLVCLLICNCVFEITERRDMGLYEVPLSMSLLGFGMGTMLANFHMCSIMFC